MRSFGEYVRDHRLNALYNCAKSYAYPDYFMSFTEATWERSKSTNATPNGIFAYSIEKTLHLWEDTDEGKYFSGRPHKKLFILKSNQEGSGYTADRFEEDIVTLESLFNFKPNKKLIKSLLENGQKDAVWREQNKFKAMVSEATAHLDSPETKLWEVTKWIAAGNKNPAVFPDNAPQRWNNIFRKLGYDAIEVEETAIFFDVHSFEVIDEIHEYR